MIEVNQMKEITEQLKIDEGFRSQLYKCPAGKWTIGFGRNLEDRGITEDEALHLLQNDIIKCMVEVRGNFECFDALNVTRQNVLLNMCYNLGIGRLLGFKKMIAALEQGDYIKASLEMEDSKWSEQVGDRADRLAKQMKDGGMGIAVGNPSFGTGGKNG